MVTDRVSKIVQMAQPEAASHIERVQTHTDIGLAMEGFRAMMRLCGEDPLREGLLDSPSRMLKAFIEMTSGLREDPTSHLKTLFSMEDPELMYDEVIVSGGIPFSSLCEHHWLPFTGVAHIGYIPNESGKVVGLSKLARVLDVYARRPQVQEKLTAQVARDIQTALSPRGVAVVIKGHHTCQCLRGVKKDGFMITSSLHGAFKDEPSARAEFFKLIEI